MKIHDALIYEFMKPDKSSKPTGDIVKIAGTGKMTYKLEEYYPFRESARTLSRSVAYGSLETIKEMTPDIEITRLEPTPEQKEKVVVELETDVDFDFGESLRQIKKYKNISSDVRVIIPREYEKFVPFYKNEGFRVYLWEAIRIWQCLGCKNETEIQGPFIPKCKKCKSGQHRLTGLKEGKFEESS